MRRIDYIVIHTTATAQNATIEAIRNGWRRLGWKSPGYHFIYDAAGRETQLQDVSLATNGVRGFNANSIHLAYIGGLDSQGRPIDNRTAGQKAAMLKRLVELKRMFPNAKIQGHRDFSPDKNGNGKIDRFERIKECPCFDAIPEFANL